MENRIETDPGTSDARLRTLATSTSSVLWITSSDGSVVVQNPSWEAFTGQPVHDYLGWGWLEAIHPDDRLEVRQAWQAGVMATAPLELRYRLRRRDGRYRHMSAQAAPVVADGAVKEWVGISIDVTESLLAEDALRASEERYRFLDRLGQATRSLNDAGQLMSVTARMLGEHLGATRCAYADVEPDNDRFTIRNDWSVAGIPTSAGVYSLDLFGPQATSNLRNGRHLVVRDVDGELGDDGGARMFNAIQIKAIITAPLVKEGRLVAMMAVHSATPRDWAARDIALVEEVVDRCWAHIERVRDAAMLREQDRHKDEFLATLAHELRNPLAPVRYALAIMRLSDDPSRATQAREMIDRQVGHMARLIDDLLDLSRVNRGLIELKREVVGINSLLEQAIEATRPAIESGLHRLEVRLAQDDLRVDADPARVVQMVGNLLNNAAKYTLDGGDIRVAAWRDGRHAVIEVSDNGVGIPPDQQGRLFQMFTQLNHTAKRARGGLGIGLSLVKTLAQMHGGRVRVFSRGLDEGSTFTIELPLAAEQARREHPMAAGVPSADAARPRKARVLVVEDNEDGRASLMALLEIMGYTVGAAADGPSALERARQFRPHIVLLDLGLPGIDGYEVAARLRSDPTHAGLVIVALTGWGASRDKERTAQSGFDAHLVKPVDPDALSQCLTSFAA